MASDRPVLSTDGGAGRLKMACFTINHGLHLAQSGKHSQMRAECGDTSKKKQLKHKKTLTDLVSGSATDALAVTYFVCVMSHFSPPQPSSFTFVTAMSSDRE